MTWTLKISQTGINKTFEVNRVPLTLTVVTVLRPYIVGKGGQVGGGGGGAVSLIRKTNCLFFINIVFEFSRLLLLAILV